jgi:hypothetical protein
MVSNELLLRFSRAEARKDEPRRYNGTEEHREEVATKKAKREKEDRGLAGFTMD